MSSNLPADPVVRVTYWKDGDPWTYCNYMPRSWIERAMKILGGVRWRVGR